MERRLINETGTIDHGAQPPDTLLQTVKWVVYSLLLVNWGYYIFEDYQVAAITLGDDEPLSEWLNVYATSLDELGWFALLLLFELETYWLSDDALTRLTRWSLVGVRVVCYFFLANTVYSYFNNYVELTDAVALNDLQSLCGLANDSFTFVRNLQYDAITPGNCDVLGSGQLIYQIGTDRVVTDAAGLAELKLLAYFDIEDAIVWLAVVILIEMTVQAQERGIASGPIINVANIATKVLYAILLMHAGIWFWKGHWVYTWDQLLWIGGFAAIGANLSDWRDELRKVTASGAAPA